MEPMLKTHVLYELESEQAFLRLRACWMYGEFSGMNFADTDHVKQSVDGIYKNLFHSSVPVKLEACLALSKFLKNTLAEQFLKPALKSLLEVFLSVMEEIDSEELVAALETIMTIFRDDIGPYALQIVGQLAGQYKRIMDNPDDEEDGE